MHTTHDTAMVRSGRRLQHQTRVTGMAWRGGRSAWGQFLWGRCGRFRPEEAWSVRRQCRAPGCRAPTTPVDVPSNAGAIANAGTTRPHSTRDNYVRAMPPSLGTVSKTYNTDRDGFSKRQRREGRCCYLNPVSVSSDITHDLDRRHAAPGM